MIERESFKIVILLAFASSLVYSLCVGIPQVKFGLELTDMVPKGTAEYNFLDVQKKYFNFYNMFAVTQGNFEYPTNQKLLMEYHRSFTRVQNILKNDDGGLPDFWLISFRDWLLNLQAAFDQDHERGCITQEQWCPEASDDAIFAYKLLIQTGKSDYPIDKTLVSNPNLLRDPSNKFNQINKVRLVNAEGIINPKAFYVYLTAWHSNDVLAYSSSKANLKPEPREFIHDPKDTDLLIKKSSPIEYAQMPFYLHHMVSTEDTVETIREIRSICQKFEERGLPNFPNGLPFVFWEQFVFLWFYFLGALVIVLSVVFLVVGIYLCNVWAASLVVISQSAVFAQVLALMGILQITLSAAPAVIMIIGVGIGSCSFFHFSVVSIQSALHS